MKVFISDDDMCTTQKLNLARVQKWFESNNCEIVNNTIESDVNIILTCNGWSLLEQKSYDRITSIISAAPRQRNVVMGCVVDAHPRKVKKIFDGETVRTKSSSPMSFEDIDKLFPEFEVRLCEVPAQGKFRRIEDYRDYNPTRLFVNISEGCAFNCSFCTHKPGLGPRRSRDEGDIIAQIEQASPRPTIVHLMGMETALWGTDVGSTYPDLLNKVCDQFPDIAIHVAQFQPHGFYLYGESLTTALSRDQVVDIQIPIQSTSDRIMKMMNRKNHSELMSNHLSAIRVKNPRAVLRTDVIVGWPTETPEERYASLHYAARYFDEVAVYGIELSEDLPAWKYASDAFPQKELEEIIDQAKYYLKQRGVYVHSGQQDDPTMKSAEEQRISLHRKKIIEARK